MSGCSVAAAVTAPESEPAEAGDYSHSDIVASSVDARNLRPIKIMQTHVTFINTHAQKPYVSVPV